MKLLVLLVVAAGCGTSGPNPHELVACEGYMVNGQPAANQYQCESPCAQAGPNGGPPIGVGSACAATGAMGNMCSVTVEWMGISGCCEEQDAGKYGGSAVGELFDARFYECQ